MLERAACYNGRMMRESTKKRMEMVRLELMKSLSNNVKVQLGQESLRSRTVQDTRDLVKGTILQIEER